MKIEQQCCSFEQAKRLKELGVVQGSSYFVFGAARGLITEAWSVEGHEDDFLAAFTVSELGVMLPFGFHSWFDGEHWHCGHESDGEIHMVGMTQAEAMTEELLSKIKYGHITPDQVNQRLAE